MTDETGRDESGYKPDPSYERAYEAALKGQKAISDLALLESAEAKAKGLINQTVSENEIICNAFVGAALAGLQAVTELAKKYDIETRNDGSKELEILPQTPLVRATVGYTEGGMPPRVMLNLVAAGANTEALKEAGFSYNGAIEMGNKELVEAFVEGGHKIEKDDISYARRQGYPSIGYYLQTELDRQNQAFLSGGS